MWWLLVLLLPVASAATVEVNGVIVDYDEKLVKDTISIDTFDIDEENMHVWFVVTAPNPCYTPTYEVVYEEYPKIKVYLIEPPAGTVCIQRTQEFIQYVTVKKAPKVEIDVEFAGYEMIEKNIERERERIREMEELVDEWEGIREQIREMVREAEEEIIRKGMEERGPWMPEIPVRMGPECERIFQALKESNASDRAFQVIEKICIEKPEEALKEICEEGVLPLPLQERFCGAVVVKDKTIEELKKEIERLRRELREAREEIKRLRIRVEELKKKLLITAQGLVDPETGEVIEVPEVEVEVNVENKQLKIVKEQNRIKMRVEGNIVEGNIEVEVNAPVAVAQNTIEVNGRPVRVTPDELLQRIRERIRALEKVELTVENEKPVYRVKAKTEGRFLFLIPVEIPVEIEIDAEEGEEVREIKPWWAFLVFP